MLDPLLTPIQVGEWINENPETVIEWGEEGTNLFPYPIPQSDGTLRWKRSHVQTWLESMENHDVGFIQHPERKETQDTLHPQTHRRIVDGDEGEPTQA
jgi:predicted DNA-binding transcriptional regulator AlpA